MDPQSRIMGDWKIVVPGVPRLDAYVAEEFKAGLLEAAKDGTKQMILDLHDVEFMDSSGLGAIVCCLQRMPQGARIAIAGAQEPVALMLRLTNIDKVLTLVDRPEDIVEHAT